MQKNNCSVLLFVQREKKNIYMYIAHLVQRQIRLTACGKEGRMSRKGGGLEKGAEENGGKLTLLFCIVLSVYKL